MLTKEQLIQLNDQMLSLGAPVERDYSGYNQPDFMKMRGLGFMPEITDLMAYAIADSLSHYKNTQLADYGSEIEETLEHYKEKAALYIPQFDMDRGMFRTAYSDYCREHKVHDFIYLAHYDADSLYLHINGFSKELNAFKNDHRDKVSAVYENNRWNTRVRWDFVNDYIKYAKDAGRGYVPDPNLQTFINDKMQPILEQLAKNADEPAIVKYVKQELGEVTLSITFGEKSEARRKMLRDFKYGLYNIGRGHSVYVKPNEFGMMIAVTLNISDLEHVVKGIRENFGSRARILPEVDNAVKAYNNFITPEYQLQVPPDSELPFIPYPFQIDDAREIMKHTRTLIGHEMGLGKTFIATLIGNSIAGKKLVVCPEALRLNWKREVNKVFPGADVKCCTNKQYEIGNDWTIMGYRTAVKYSHQLQQEKFNCAFIDEAHNIKAVNNYGRPASARADNVIGLCEDIKYVYPMTGTPIPTRNKDLYNILHMLRSPIAKTFYNYAVDYCGAVKDEYGLQVSDNTNSESLHEYLDNLMVRRLKKEVLPDLQKIRRFVPLDVMNNKIKNLEAKLYDTDDKETFMGLCMSGRNLLSQAKVKSVIEYADELISEGRSVVIVTNFNSTLDAIKDYYAKAAEKDPNAPKAVFVRGGMTDVQKTSAVDDFQSGKAQVCAVNIIAGGVGLTLTKAHDLIMTDFDWTPANMVQAEDRICRVGQDELCNITYFYCEGSDIDEYFVDMLTSKSANIDKAVDASENTLNLYDTYVQARLKPKPEKEKKGKKRKADPEKQEDSPEER